jgi:hypothetical protein
VLLSIAAAVAIAAAVLVGVRSASHASSAPPAPDAAPAPAVVPRKTSIPYADARAVLSTHQERLPIELKGKTPAELESAWPTWVARHNADIRTRLERGDEDSVVNFWVYGTTFTTLPRATQRDIGRASAEEVLLGRLDDLVAGLAAPGANDRLRFARQVVERRGIDPATPEGREQARRYLVEIRERVIADNARYRRLAESAARLGDRGAELSAFATLYRDRGLSSDTSINADFVLDHAFDAIKAAGRLGAGSVRRVAVIGPGLDFTDKAEGYDFYPQQTIQPFAVIVNRSRSPTSRRCCARADSS